MKKSIDLTTLPAWSSLSSGSHSITIVAKAENYRDSEPSAAVSVTKGAAGYTITINNIGDYGSYDIVGGAEAGTYEVGTNKGSHTYHNVTDITIRPYSSCTISNGTGNFINGEVYGAIHFTSDSTATLTWID